MADVASLGIKVDSTDVKKASIDLVEFEKKSEKAGESVKSFGSHAKTSQAPVVDLSSAVKALAGYLAGLASINIAKGFIETAASFEAMGIKLDALTSGHGQETLKALSDWAMEMPVSTKKATEAFVQMKAMGLDPTIAKMTTLSDVSVLLGEDAMPRITRALGQMSSAGKLFQQDLNQLKEVGINVNEMLQKSFGMSVDEIQKSGISMKKIIDAIWAGLDEKFGGSSLKMQNTWQGLTERMSDHWDMFKKSVMDSGPFDALKSYLVSVMSKIDELKKNGKLDEWARDMAKGILEAIKVMLTGFETLANGVSSVRWAFGSVVESVAGEMADKMKKGIDQEKDLLADLEAGGLRSFWRTNIWENRDEKIIATKKAISEMETSLASLKITEAAGGAQANDAAKNISTLGSTIDGLKKQLDGFSSAKDPIKGGIFSDTTSGTNIEKVSAAAKKAAAEYATSLGNMTDQYNQLAISEGNYAEIEDARAKEKIWQDWEKEAAKMSDVALAVRDLSLMEVDRYGKVAQLREKDAEAAAKETAARQKEYDSAEKALNNLESKKHLAGEFSGEWSNEMKVLENALDVGKLSFDEFIKKQDELEASISAKKANKYADYYKDIVGMETEYQKYKFEWIDNEEKRLAAFYSDDVAAAKWAYEEKKKIIDEEILKTNDFFGGMKVGYDELQKDAMNGAKAGLKVIKDFASSGATALSDGLFNTIKGEMNSFSDAWQAFCDSMLRTFTDIIAQMAMNDMIKLLFGSGSSLSGGISIVTGSSDSVPSSSGGAVGAASSAVSLASLAKSLWNLPETLAALPDKIASAYTTMAGWFSGSAASTAGAGAAAGAETGGAIATSSGASAASSVGGGAVAGAAGALFAVMQFVSSDTFYDLVTGGSKTSYQKLSESEAGGTQLDSAIRDWLLADLLRSDNINMGLDNIVTDMDSFIATHKELLSMTMEKFDYLITQQADFAASAKDTSLNSLGGFGINYTTESAVNLAVQVASDTQLTLEEKMYQLGFFANQSGGWETDATMAMIAQFKNDGVPWDEINQALLDYGATDADVYKRIYAEYHGDSVLTDLTALETALKADGYDEKITKVIEYLYESNLPLDQMSSILRQQGLAEWQVEKIIGQIDPSDEWKDLTIPVDAPESIPVDYGGFGGARASGGSVIGGTPYLVGEQGAELFVPNQSGTILNNSQIGYSASGEINITFNVTNSSGGQVNARATKVTKSDQGFIVDMLIDAVERNVGGIQKIGVKPPR